LSSSARDRRARGRGWAIAGWGLGLTLCIAVPAVAGDRGARTGAFADLEPGGRGAALGGAFAPLVDDPTAIHWNPSRLAMVEARGIAATYSDLFGLHLARHAAFFVAWPHHDPVLEWDRGTLTTGSRESHSAWGVGIQSTQVDLDPESYAEYDLALAHARRGRLGLNWGLAGHLLFVRSDLDGVSASGFAHDLALSRTIASRIDGTMRIDGTLVVRSLLSDLSWKNAGREPLTRTAEAGVGIGLGPLRVPATLTLDLDAGALRQAAAGAEWSPVGPALTLRGGLRWRDDGDRAEVRGGGGVGLRWKEIAFDYGLALGPSELGETHHFGLRLGF